MFNLSSAFGVIFFVASISLIALLLVTFVTIIARKKRKNSARSFLVGINSVIFILAFITSAVFLVCNFPSAFLTFSSLDNNLILTCFNKQIFAIFGAGATTNKLLSLKAFGYISQILLMVTALVNIIVLKLKSKQRITAPIIEEKPIEEEKPAPIAEEKPIEKIVPLVEEKPIEKIVPLVEEKPIEEKVKPIVEKVKLKVEKTAPIVKKATPIAEEKPIVEKTVEGEIVKEVHALPNNLPVTRRFVVLNRQNAANVFVDYLKEKDNESKSALQNSINTIILK